MNRAGVLARAPSRATTRAGRARGAVGEVPDATTFSRAFAALFAEHYPTVFRFLDRVSGDADLAADLAQETFLRLHRRGVAPDAPAAWLITVALNLFRNAKTSARRRRELLTVERGSQLHSQPSASSDELEGEEDRRRIVRAALDRLPERDRQLLLLRAEGYEYRELAAMLSLNAASVGVLLARAKQKFLAAYSERDHAS